MEESDDEQNGIAAYKLVMRIGAPIIITFGLVGNILSLLVLRSRFFRQVPSSIGFTLLAVADICILLTLLPRWIGSISNGTYSFSDSGIFGCKADAFLTHFFAFLGPWTLVIITIERIISVVAPIRHSWICKPRNVLITWILLCMLLFGCNTHFFWTQTLISKENTTAASENHRKDCTPRKEHYIIWDVWPWVDFIVSFAAPFLILLTCNISIVIFLCRNYSRYRSFVGRETSSLDRITSTTVMLVTVAIVHLLTTSPVVIFGLFLNYFNIVHTFADHDTVDLIINIVVLLFHLNSAVNFLLYFVSNSLFRKAARHLLCCRRPRANENGTVGDSSWNYEGRTEMSMSNMNRSDNYS